MFENIVVPLFALLILLFVGIILADQRLYVARGLEAPHPPCISYHWETDNVLVCNTTKDRMVYHSPTDAFDASGMTRPENCNGYEEFIVNTTYYADESIADIYLLCDYNSNATFGNYYTIFMASDQTGFDYGQLLKHELCHVRQFEENRALSEEECYLVAMLP